MNYSDHQGQCYVALPWDDLREKTVRLADRLGPAVYERSGDDLSARGLYLDLPAWAFHVFDVARAGDRAAEPDETREALHEAAAPA